MIWDAASGRKVRTLVRHTHELGVLAFRPPDGRQLAVAALDNTVGLWDVTTGQAVHTFGGVIGFNGVIAFSPDGRRLAAGGGENRVVSVWDVANGREIWALRGRADTLPTNCQFWNCPRPSASGPAAVRCNGPGRHRIMFARHSRCGRCRARHG